jgi:arsenate reductase
MSVSREKKCDFTGCVPRHKAATSGLLLLTCRMAPPTIQIFGTRKCNETRKAERFFKERGVKVQSVDLAEKPMSAGELRSVASATGGMAGLLDSEGKRYLEKGLKYSAPTGPRIEALLLEDPLLLKTPLVRAGKAATVGYQPEVWKSWLAGG